MRKKSAVALFIAFVGLAAPNVATAHGVFKKALAEKYGFKSVSCYTCHKRGKNPATDKPYTKEHRNDFGKLFVPHLDGEDIAARVAKSSELKKDRINAAAKAEAAQIDKGIATDFLRALQEVEAMNADSGETYGNLLKAGKIPGAEF